jgi:hypothetical protein
LTLQVIDIGAGAGVDSTWEQEKLEARECLKMRQNPQRPVHPIKMAGHHFSKKDAKDLRPEDSRITGERRHFSCKKPAR